MNGIARAIVSVSQQKNKALVSFMQSGFV